MANEEYQIPIFLINGQLDSGKTRFISDTIAMGQFADAKNKLLIVCEEGEEEYSEKLLKDNGVDMVVVEKEDFNIKTLGFSLPRISAGSHIPLYSTITIHGSYFLSSSLRVLIWLL